MKNKLIRITSLVLVIITVLSLFAGCGKKDVEIVPLVPEKQIFEDSYTQNQDINEFMKYATDYITYDNSSIGNMTVYNLFDLASVQVDDWESIIIGKTTMKEIVKIIDESNKNYVEAKTQAVIDQRQAIIDQEYEEAKAEAEKKGKEYKKEKKQVRTDDIHFDNPYTYTVTLGTGKKVYPEEYKETLLVDPTKCRNISFDITKYGIPYVHLDFSYLNGVYNTRITQEADWVVNGIKAADVTEYVLGDEKTRKKNAKNGVEIALPEYYDSDGLNKAAKKNMVMSGDIRFSGEGFNWDSLMVLCNALNLGEKDRKQGFFQSSDDKFAYYTIVLCTNPENTNPQAFSDENIMFPMLKLVATFDRLTQECLNWTVDTYSSTPTRVSGKNHDVVRNKSVNVKKFQVDTNNYSGMRKQVNTWIDEHAAGKLHYCAFDTTKADNKKNGFIGVVNTGLTNIDIEPVINDVQYVCLSSKREGDAILGEFITKEDNDKAATMGDKAAAYIESHKLSLKIAPAIVNGDDLVAHVVNDNKIMTALDGKTIYQVARFEKDGFEYKDVALLDSENTYKLLMFYIATYKLNSTQTDGLRTTFDEKGLVGVRAYVDELFAEAEEEQNKLIAQKEEEGKDILINVFDDSTVEIDKQK
jgi:hypothetical protein